MPTLFKFSHGGWFTLLVGGLLSIIMFTWYNGRKITKQVLRFLPPTVFRRTYRSGG
jgi:KUP system potassium uptake protein